ncbi:MAG TPA: hypothetical protein VIM73_16625 [Polyangiaceae bacterium]
MIRSCAPRRRARRSLLLSAGVCAALWGPAGAGGLVSCSAESTAGKRVELETSVRAKQLSFTNEYGFAVEISKMLVSIGPLRYLEGAPVARRLRPAWLPFSVKTAHAHPGHYVAGGIVGEMLEPATVDLATGPALLARGQGVTGTALSALFSFESPPRGPLAEELAPDVVLVEGISISAEGARRFRARAAMADIADAQGEPFVAGCPFDDGAIDADGHVTLTIDPGIWFDQVDFSLLSQLAGDAAVELRPGETPHKAFVRGLKKAIAYSFSYSAQTESTH